MEFVKKNISEISDAVLDTTICDLDHYMALALTEKAKRVLGHNNLRIITIYNLEYGKDAVFDSDKNTQFNNEVRAALMLSPTTVSVDIKEIPSQKASDDQQ